MFDLLRSKLSEFLAHAEKRVVPSPSDEREKAEKKEQEKVAPLKETRVETERTDTHTQEFVKLGIVAHVKGVVTGKVTLQEKDIRQMVEELELSFIESDMTLPCAEYLTIEIRHRLIGSTFNHATVKEEIRQKIIEILEKSLQEGRITLTKKPYIILCVGPNGAGKTTTIAKLAYWFCQRGKRPLLVAADTFRAAAIEQLEKHGEALNVEVVKHTYGSDAAAVAYEGISRAVRRGYDVVLIDSAGRQENNTNLMRELQKITRVAKPDLTLFVGEAIAGHALVEQARTFHTYSPIEGFILTKMDCDTKGGIVFALCIELKKPCYFYGTGEEYTALVPFDKQEFVKRLMSPS